VIDRILRQCYRLALGRVKGGWPTSPLDLSNSCNNLQVDYSIRRMNRGGFLFRWIV
jgi:hypothetical protein